MPSGPGMQAAGPTRKPAPALWPFSKHVPSLIRKFLSVHGRGLQAASRRTGKAGDLRWLTLSAGFPYPVECRKPLNESGRR